MHIKKKKGLFPLWLDLGMLEEQSHGAPECQALCWALGIQRQQRQGAGPH